MRDIWSNIKAIFIVCWIQSNAMSFSNVTGSYVLALLVIFHALPAFFISIILSCWRSFYPRICCWHFMFFFLPTEHFVFLLFSTSTVVSYSFQAHNRNIIFFNGTGENWNCLLTWFFFAVMKSKLEPSEICKIRDRKLAQCVWLYAL